MKRLISLACIAIACLSAGCAIAQPASSGATVAAPTTTSATPAAQTATLLGIDLSKIPLVKFGHADVQNAAAYATANGYSARAAFWLALDAQVTACENALQAAAPKAPAAGGTVGLATGFEIAAEAVGNGLIPAQVKINCSLITLPSL